MTRTDEPRNASGISPTREDGFPKTQNPATYVLVHGAWHGSWCWKRIRKGLRDTGHQVFTPTLTGLGERSHLNSATIDLSTHIADVVNLLRWEDLSDVILCGHSYGGSVIRGIADRVPERIRTLVYLDAFVPEDGECLFDLHAPEHAQHMRLHAQTAGAGWNVPPIPAERFNVNLRDAAWVNAQCTPQSIASFEERIKLNRLPSRTHDTSYILATGWDNSPFRAAHKRAKAKGWQTRTITCGHEVMLDLPGELTDLEIDLAGDVRTMPEAAEILTQALGRPIAFAQTPIEQVRQYSKDMALMLQWFERVGYSADIAGLEREFGRALTKLPDWARRHARPNGQGELA